MDRRRLCQFLIAITLLTSSSLCRWNAYALPAQDEVRWATEVEMVKGHLTASLEAYRAGMVSLAKKHVGHGLAEHFAVTLAAPLGRRDRKVEQQLSKALASLSEGIRAKGDLESYEAKVGQTFALLDEGLGLLAPKALWRDAVFVQKVIAFLLVKISREYAEAVKETKVTNLLEYQDAFGIFQRAKALFRTWTSLVPIKTSSRDDMERLFARLEQALSNIVPPAALPPPATLEGWITNLSRILQEESRRQGR